MTVVLYASPSDTHDEEHNAVEQVDQRLEDLYELVLEHCNLEPVKDLLRKYKNDDDLPKESRSDVLISGKAEKVVRENLKKAVDRKIIPVSEVYRLLQEAEENGRQHIFFFRPSDESVSAELCDQRSVAQCLFGKAEKLPFPVLRLKPLGFCWSDFRLIGKNGWIAKLYGHEVKERVADGEREAEGRARWIKMEEHDVRTVSTVRWLAEESLLELRVSEMSPRALLDELTKRIRPLVDIHKSCVPWNLSPVRHVLMQEKEEHSNLYECGKWEVVDSESYAIQGAPLLQDPEESVHATTETRGLIGTVAASNSWEKRKLVVNWKPTSENGNKRVLRTILGTIQFTNEVIISAQATSRAIDDVVLRLLEFEERSTGIEPAVGNS